ncbi:MAG TPA: alpha-2-macroglobulin family protein [Pirellulaceae bacterium]|nr:alpha-2-macroglobulin family protein [Pirellulaceae bacterium]
MKIPRNDHVLEYVDTYLHTALDEDDARFVEEHCDGCSICAAALHEAQKRFETLQTVAPSEAPESLIKATLESVEDRVERRRRGWKTYGRSVLLVLAASVMITTGLHIHYGRMQATPYDLRILGQAKWLAGSISTLRLAVLDHRTGKALGNIPATLSLRDQATEEVVELVSFVTGNDGEETPRFQLPEWSDGRYDLLFTAKVDGHEETLQQTIRLQRTWKLMLSTDKPLYQPGQTIHMRSMALRQPDLKPMAGQTAVFEITDSKGNMIFKKKATTSEFGIAHADCVLAGELNIGTYAVKCRMNDTASTRSIDVQRYVLPKFRVALSADRPYYQPSQEATVIVDAQYFFGKPVASGKVELQVFGEAAGLFEIDRIEKDLDENGQATFSLSLLEHFVGRPQNQGDAAIQFFAKVTDSTGLQYSKQLKRIVTSNPIHIEVIPESPTLTPGVANRVYLYTSYADGRPAKTRVVVHGVAEDLETTPLGVATFDITPGTNSMSLTIRATDSEGATGVRQAQFAQGRPETFVLRTNKAVYDGGETMTVQCVGSGVEPVFVDFVKEDQSLVTVMVEMKNGKGLAELELPPEVFGPIHIVAHRFDRQGLAIQKSRAVFVRQPNQLQIKATMDHQKYRPGETAKVKFTITDDDGKPVPSALSLAIVDEAVFSVMDQAAGMEKVFFLLENELLQPVYAIYNWTPDWSGEIALEERELFEQALFSRTAAESANSYSLTAVSFPAKQSQVSQTRKAGLRLASRAWVSLFCVWTLVAVGTFAVAKPKWFLVLFGGMFALFICLVIPASFLALNATVSRMSAEKAMANFLGRADDDSAMEAPMAEPTSAEGIDAGAEGTSEASLPTIRKRFPETLLWNPELITDNRGSVELDVPLADSITTWRITASCVSAGGQLGAEQFPLKVFQPFFVDVNSPYALTRLDEVDLPVAIYNYLDEPQTVEIKMEEADWFQWRQGKGGEDQEPGRVVVELQPNEVRGVSFPIQVRKAGKQFITVTARAGESADAVKRPITILPGGKRVEQIASGKLPPKFSTQIKYPQEAIENSLTAYVKIYPSAFSELVEGLENIFSMPSGCFEQTSSTTYPNILALNYLRKTQKSVPELEAKAREYIHVGYQRLVSFEVGGGGFDWFGRPPANLTLTAYGLMEFEDMANVYDVDPKLIQRTRRWLLSKRHADGSWKPLSEGIDDGLFSSVHRGSDIGLAMTAYVARAVFYNEAAASESSVTLDYLLSHPANSLDDPYLLAMIANAVASIDAQRPELTAYYDRLIELKKVNENGKKIWWERAGDDSTLFYGNGRSGDIETTALVAQALMRSRRFSAVVNSALTWIVEQKDERGTWHSTQATVLSLQALIQAAVGGVGSESIERQIELSIDDNVVQNLTIPASENEVVQHMSLSRIIEPGDHQLSIRDVGEGGANFQLVFVYHMPVAGGAEPVADQSHEPLNVTINYDRTRLKVNEHITAEAIVVNKTNEVAPMVILDLPIPGGFALETEDLDELVGSKLIEKYQITPRKAIVYLRGIMPGKPLQLRYRLKATMPVKVQAAPAEAYQYYDPDSRGKSVRIALEALAT